MVDRGENGRTLTIIGIAFAIRAFRDVSGTTDTKQRVRIPFGRDVGAGIFGRSTKTPEQVEKGKTTWKLRTFVVYFQTSKLTVTEKIKNIYTTHSAEFLINYRS